MTVPLQLRRLDHICSTTLPFKLPSQRMNLLDSPEGSDEKLCYTLQARTQPMTKGGSVLFIKIN